MNKFISAALALLASSSIAFAQTAPVKISSAWWPQGRLTSAINATASSAATLLPTPGFIANVCNTGAVDAYVAFGGSTVTASTASATSSWVKASTCAAYDLKMLGGAITTYIAAVTPSSTTTLSVETGLGTPPSSLAASGGGGGGGGPVTLAAGAVATGAYASGSIGAGAFAVGSVPASAFAAGYSVDMGNCATATPWTGSGTPSLCSLLLGSYVSINNPIAAQTAHGVLIGAVEGQSADDASITENPVLGGARAQNAEPASLATNGQKSHLAVGLEGKLINLPYANKENMLRGSASATTTAAATLIASQTGLKIYVTGISCYREDTGTTPMHVTLNDTASTVIGLPNAGNGGGNNPAPFIVPLVVAVSTALTFTESTNTTTVYCNAQGYSGS